MKDTPHAYINHALSNKNKSIDEYYYPSGTSRLINPNKVVVYYTKCDNGSRLIPKYYVNGIKTNALGIPLSEKDIKMINKNKCTGCQQLRCRAKYYHGHTTAQKKKKERRIYPNNFYPKPSPYFMGPLTTK